MFVRVIPEPEIDKITFLIFLPITLNTSSTKMSLFDFLVPIFFNSFAIEFTNDISPLVGRLNTSGRINSLGGPNLNSPNCTNLETEFLKILY